MYFPISGVHLNPIYLVVIGFIIGVLGGFFGVGGSFLTSPALFAAGLPMNYVVGTDLAHIVGKSIVAARTHRVLGNIDLKLAGIMVIGTITGSEAGVQAIEILKKGAHVELVVGIVSIVVFTGISLFCAWESLTALRLNKLGGQKPGQNRMLPRSMVLRRRFSASSCHRTSVFLIPELSRFLFGQSSLFRSSVEFSADFSAEVPATFACLQWFICLASQLISLSALIFSRSSFLPVTVRFGTQ